ncbi:MAG: lytic transglycosylase domain-containing protein [Terricaulis sp.]
MHVSRIIRVALLAASSVLLLNGSSLGQQNTPLGPDPMSAPAANNNSAAQLQFSPTPDGERDRLRQGLAAADSDDWATLASLRDNARDPVVRKILEWKWASASDAPLYFDDIRIALNDLQGWPGRTAMRTRAEQAIFDSRLSAAERDAFLRQDGGPLTGDGKIALALALRQEGNTQQANELARTAFRQNLLTDTAEAMGTSNFSLTSEDYADRVDMLLWRGQRSEAQHYASHLGVSDRALMNARIALQTRQRRHLQQVVDAVPGSRADDAGFIYDRAQYRRRTNNPEDAMALIARIHTADAPVYARDLIYKESRLYVPRALRNGNPRLAYQLVSDVGLSSGEFFADSEFVSGWLQLRFLHQPSEAAAHFARMSDGVSAPVSRSRALYWRAEALRAMGNTADADAALAQAAQYPFTYYGQLAATYGGRSAVMSLPDTTVPGDAARARFQNRELVRALQLIAQVGAQRDFEAIAFYLDDSLDDPMEIELLSQMAREQSYQRTALRSAKAGLFRNVVAVNAAYPLMQLPPSVQQSGRPEPALVLSIIRQESEFDAGASSGANAHGLMQLIPSTARATARQVGMTYDRGSLSDPQYNVTLGATYLANLIDQFNGSYVLAAASYNAGDFNARDWIGDWGDPRSSGVDVVDWIELIPFGETRNYVQRVIENLQVYRYRLAGQPTPITIQQDLKRGHF